MPMKELKGSFQQMMATCQNNKHIGAIVLNTNSVIKENSKATFKPEVTNAIPIVEFDIEDHDGKNKRTMRATLGARLGQLMKDSRHIARVIGRLPNGKRIIGLPHKFSWRDKEDLSLIEREAENLVIGINKRGWTHVCMMRPVEDSSVWESFKSKLETIFSKTECVIGVYDGTYYLAPPPKPVKPKAFKDCTDEEKKARRKAAAAKAQATKAAKKAKAEDPIANLENEQEARVRQIEAEIGEQMRELD